MRAASNSLRPVFHENRRSLVTRVPSDNDLLAACDKLHGGIIRACAMSGLCGLGVGCVWFLCVAIRAGVLPWSF